MKPAVSARLAEPARFSTTKRSTPSPLRTIAARAARHFGDDVGAEALDDLVERAGNRRQRRQLLDQAVAARDGVPASHRLAVADRPAATTGCPRCR